MLNNAMEIVLCIKKIHYVIVQKKKVIRIFNSTRNLHFRAEFSINNNVTFLKCSDLFAFVKRVVLNVCTIVLLMYWVGSFYLSSY